MQQNDRGRLSLPPGSEKALAFPLVCLSAGSRNDNQARGLTAGKLHETPGSLLWQLAAAADNQRAGDPGRNDPPWRGSQRAGSRRLRTDAQQQDEERRAPQPGPAPVESSLELNGRAE